MKATERLAEYMAYKGLKPTPFNNTIGASNGYIANAIKHKRSLGSHVLEEIFYVYSDLNPTWLLTGKGNMLISEYKIDGNSSQMRVEEPNSESFSKEKEINLEGLVREISCNEISKVVEGNNGIQAQIKKLLHSHMRMKQEFMDFKIGDKK